MFLRNYIWSISSKRKIAGFYQFFFKINDGIITQNLYRLGFSSPEFVGINSVKLKEIENFTTKAISRKMAPGMQILVARKGKVFTKNHSDIILIIKLLRFKIQIFMMLLLLPKW